MERITAKNVDSICESLNVHLSKTGSKKRFLVSRYNGHSAIEECISKPDSRMKAPGNFPVTIYSTIYSGTSRECYEYFQAMFKMYWIFDDLKKEGISNL